MTVTAREVSDFQEPHSAVYLALTILDDAWGMPWLASCVGAFCVLLCTSVAVVAEPSRACAQAAVAAERNWTVPADLIQAIGRVESGRRDLATGRVAPWPWTVNANGSGFWFASQAEAVAFVRSLQARGVRLIDVGCFQVDLFYHPAAFSSLEQAFDPDANADYAARFLRELRGRTGSWQAAVAGYHSGQTVEGEGYRRKVMNQLGTGGTVFAAGSPVTAEASGMHLPVVRDRFVVMMSAVARAITVIRPRG